MKFKIGNRVIIYNDPNHVIYTVLASRENSNGYTLGDNMDYLIKDLALNKKIHVIEGDIILENDK